MVNPNIPAPKQPSENEASDGSERLSVIVGFDDKTGQPIHAPFEQAVGHAAMTTGSMDDMQGGYTGNAPSNNSRLVHIGGGRYVPRS